ncbi:hypothetical protein RUM43_011121 [Polyplax serrata]|uniref:Uncharacterized protein n=1 Tax=Polyplax serrata TaxID=468196 RepID=A0AAN8NXX7_POLSC
MRPPSNEPAGFGIDITNLQNNPAYMMCQRLAGRGIVRVVGRCKDAQENNNLEAHFKNYNESRLQNNYFDDL